jgi:hypothetical protein
MPVRGLGLIAFLTLAGLAPPQAVAAQAPSEEFYFSECLKTGHELGICRCQAQALAKAKDVNAELVSAIMKEYILKEGDRAIDPARVKQDLPRLKIAASDDEIAKAVEAAAEGAKCQE